MSVNFLFFVVVYKCLFSILNCLLFSLVCILFINVDDVVVVGARVFAFRDVDVDLLLFIGLFGVIVGLGSNFLL